MALERIKQIETYSKVSGAIGPNAWDKNGEPVRYCIFTEWGDELTIKNDMDTQIKPFLNRIVEVFGNVYENDRNEKFITIRKISLLGSPVATLDEIIQDYSIEDPARYNFKQQDYAKAI